MYIRLVVCVCVGGGGGGGGGGGSIGGRGQSVETRTRGESKPGKKHHNHVVISDNMPNKGWDEITYPFPNFKGNFIPHAGIKVNPYQ